MEAGISCVKCCLLLHARHCKVLSTINHAAFQEHAPSSLSATNHTPLLNTQERNKAFEQTASPLISVQQEVEMEEIFWTLEISGTD